MRPGRRPPDDPIEQEARAALRKAPAQEEVDEPFVWPTGPAPAAPVVARPVAPKRSERKPERWR